MKNNLTRLAPFAAAALSIVGCSRPDPSVDPLTLGSTATDRSRDTEHDALLVVGPKPARDSDARLKAALEELGFTVTTKADTAVSASDAGSRSLIVISESTLSENVGNKFASVAVPVVVLEPSLFDDMNLAGSAWGTDYGDLPKQNRLRVSDRSSPLAAGLSGSVRATLAPEKFVWGKPGAGAKVALTTDGVKPHAAVFSYERGAQMVGVAVAPARRVAWFAGRDVPARLTDAGWMLFKAAVRWATAPRVLLVVDEQGANASDLAIEGRLIQRGWDVRIRGARSASTSDAEGAAVVIVSESVQSIDLGSRFAKLSVPVLVSEPSLFDDFGLTGLAWGSDYGDRTDVTSLDIVLPQHALAASLDGTVTVLTGPGKLIWGKPHHDAQVIAKLGTGEPAIFAYEKGVSLFGARAPARRLAWFAGRDEAGRYTRDGWRLFDAAMDWLHLTTKSVLTPIAECVIRVSDTKKIAMFGYRNLASIDVAKNVIGGHNVVVGGLTDQPPITNFLPGRHRGAMAVPFSGHSVSWQLDGATAVLSGMAPACDESCIDPAAKVGIVRHTFPPDQSAIDPLDGDRMTFGDALAILPPPVASEEVAAQRDSFSWQLTEPVPEFNPEGRPALYYASIYIRSRADLDLLDALQIHYDSLPLFDEEQVMIDGQPSLVPLHSDQEGGFAYVVLPGATFNAIREAALDPQEPTPLFDAVVLRPVPAVEAKECQNANFSSFRQLGPASCPLPAEFAERACAARIEYDYLGRHGFLYRGLAEGETDTKAEAAYAQFPAEDQAELRGDISSIQQPLFGRLIRKVVKKVVKVARVAVDLSRKALTQVSRLVVGSQVFTIQLDIREQDPEFAVANATKMVRTWGPPAPGGISDPPGSGAGAPVSVPGLEVRASIGPFLSTARTNGQNQATVRVLDWSSPARICLRMNSDAATLEDWFWSRTVCSFPTNKYVGRWNAQPGVPLVHFAENRFLNIMAQYSEASAYMLQIAKVRMKKVLVLIGGAANLYSSKAADGTRRAYAPCLDLPNWTNPIPTVAAAIGAEFGGRPGRWMRSKLKPALDGLNGFMEDVMGKWVTSLADAQAAAAEYRNRGLGQTADELLRLGEVAHKALTLANEQVRIARQVSEESFAQMEWAAQAVNEGRITNDDPAVTLAKDLANQAKLSLELARGSLEDAMLALDALKGQLLGLSQAAAGEVAVLALQTVRLLTIAPAVEMAANGVTGFVESIGQAATGIVFYALGEVSEIFQDADIIMPDDATRSRGVASHEYGHYVLCQLMYNEDAYKYGAAYTEMMVETTVGQLDGRDRTRDDEVVINEAFADFMAGQFIGAVNYFEVPQSITAGALNYCQATATDCLDDNIGGLTQTSIAAGFSQAVGKTMTTLHDALDGHSVGSNPGDGSVWQRAADNSITYVGPMSANVQDEVVAMSAQTLPTLVRKMFDRGILVRNGTLWGATNDVMVEVGYNWCQRCELFAIHDSMDTCDPNVVGMRPADLMCTFDGCPTPFLANAGSRRCDCPVGFSQHGATCVRTSCPPGQFLHMGACVTSCPCPCSNPQNACSCAPAFPVDSCFVPSSNGTCIVSVCVP